MKKIKNWIVNLSPVPTVLITLLLTTMTTMIILMPPKEILPTLGLMGIGVIAFSIFFTLSYGLFLALQEMLKNKEK